MKKRIIISILAFCIVLTPLTALAQEDTKTLFAEGNYKFSDELYADNEFAKEPRVTFEYASDEQEKNENAPKIGCKAAYVADPISGKVFYEKNAHKKMYPASTTKILTALVVLENCKTDDMVKISKTAINLMESGFSNAGLEAGEEHSVFTMLRALLIPSANESAYALAEHVSGSIEAFAELCNKRAKELGCETLHFVNPNGLPDENHYCSAYDLYLVAKECQKYDVFNEIVKTTSFSVPPTDIHPANDRTYINTNELLPGGNYSYSNCTGIKTGHTTPAGECLVASSSKGDLNLISVVLGGHIVNGVNERFSDTKKLFEYVYDNYEFKMIADKSIPIGEVSVKHAKADNDKLSVEIQTDIYTVTPSGITSDDIISKVNMAEEIKAPIKQGQVLGTVTYKIDGMTYSTNVVASNDVEKKPFWIYNTLVALGILLLLFIIILIIKNAKKRANK